MPWEAPGDALGGLGDALECLGDALGGLGDTQEGLGDAFGGALGSALGGLGDTLVLQNFPKNTQGSPRGLPGAFLGKLHLFFEKG